MEHSEANSPAAGPEAGGGGALKKSGVTEIFGTLMILVGILIFLAVVSFQSQLTGSPEALAPEANMIGTVGHYTAQLLLFLFGKSAFLLGPYLFLLGFLTFYRGGFTDPLSRVVAVLVVMAGTSLLGALLYQVDGRPSESAGGLLGAHAGQAFQVLFGSYGGFILAMGIFLTGVFLAIRIPVPVFLGQLNHRIVAAVRSYSRALSGQGQVGYREAYAMAGAATPPVDADPEPATDHQNQDGATQDMAQDQYDFAGLVYREAGAAGERRPWIERVSLENDPAADAGLETGAADYETDQDAGEPENATPGEDNDGLYNDFPAANEDADPPASTANIRGLDQRTRLSGNARHLQAALSRLEGRDRGPGRRVPERAEDSGSNWLNDSAAHSAPEAPAGDPGAGEFDRHAASGDLAGFFNEDETRFHFRASRGGRTARPGTKRGGAFADAAGRNVRESAYDEDGRAPGDAREWSERRGAAAPAAILEPLDVQLLHRRERRSDSARSHSLEELNPTGDMARSPDDRAQFAPPVSDDRAAAPDDDLLEATLDEAVPPESAVDNDSQPVPEAEVQELVESNIPGGVGSDAAIDMDQDGEDSQDIFEHAAGDVESAPVAADPPALAVAAPIPERKPRKKVVPASAVPKFQAKNAKRRYHLPGNLLKPGETPPREDVSREIEVTRERLEKVMQDYGIQARVVRTQRGPIITLYEVKLEAGVRVSRILGISDEIKMNLEAPSIRIIAPIPGKPTVGIEIPNRHREGVVLGDMLDRDVMSRNELCVALGKNIAGEKQYVDLARLPHLLIAGSTGSGKSVYMNAIIASLLYTRSPEDVRFIMIDPKMVELKLFEGIPHLIMPVITDVRQASKALTWVINEMERRYEILSHSKSRDIRSYNDRIAAETQLPGFEPPEGVDGGREKMPYIVVFIDELSDLMMVAAKDVEDSIIRLTQKARAVGIHIVMATQRPSVDVITALIKANCPARIAFHVAQKTDSRTILDMNGAETLLGKGDMLYRSPSSTALVRLQAPLLTEAEIENVVQETARYGEPSYVDLEAYIEEESTEAAENDVDSELLQQAWKIVLESGKTSTSYIQRRLRIGYNRAASLIEMLEQKGYLSPAIGNKPREILKRS